MKDDKGIMGRI